jgi:hypothetical protein
LKGDEVPVELKQVESLLYTDYFQRLTEREQKILTNTICHDINKLEQEFGNEVMMDVFFKCHRWIEVHNWSSGSVVSDWRKKFNGVVKELRSKNVTK